METEYTNAAGNAAKKKGIKRGGIGVGTTSLLVIFTMLCMTTLALLSLSSAISNQRIQQRGIDSAVGLATAYGEADRVYAEIDACLVEAAARGKSNEEYLTYAMKLLAEIGCQATGPDSVGFSLQIDEGRALICEARLNPLGESQRFVETARYVEVVTDWSTGGESIWPGN